MPEQSISAKQSISDADPEICQFEEFVHTDDESYCGDSITDDYLSETDSLENEFLEEMEANTFNECDFRRHHYQ